MQATQAKSTFRTARNAALVAAVALTLNHSTLLRAQPDDPAAAIRQKADSLLEHCRTDSSRSPIDIMKDELVTARMYRSVGLTNEWKGAVGLAAGTTAKLGKSQKSRAWADYSVALYSSIGEQDMAKKTAEESGASTTANKAIKVAAIIMIGLSVAATGAALLARIKRNSNPNQGP
jgi:hypothetical protein